MKIAKIFFVSIVAFLTGCATTEVSTEFNKGIMSENAKPLGAIIAENYGYYLFGYFPIVTGDSDAPNDVSINFFSDMATIENNQKMLNQEAEKLGANAITNVRHKTSWTGSFSFWIIWKQVLSSNALAIKKCEASPEKTPVK